MARAHHAHLAPTTFAGISASKLVSTVVVVPLLSTALLPVVKMPEGLAVDTAGNLYVTDAANGRVVKLQAG